MFSRRCAGRLGTWIYGQRATGTPYSVYNTNDCLSGGDYNRDGYDYDYPNMPATNFSGSHTRTQFLNGIYYGYRLPDTHHRDRRKIQAQRVPQPRLLRREYKFDQGKQTAIPGEHGTLQIRGDFFNLFNRTNLGAVDSDLADSTFGRCNRSWIRE